MHTTALSCTRGFLLALCALALMCAAAPGRAAEPPSAHNPCYDDRKLWPESVKETAYYKEKWEPARVLIWAKGSLKADNIADKNNWTEGGKPAAQDTDVTCDLVFPAQDKETVVDGGFNCRHVTVGKNVRVTGLGVVTGNVWAIDGGWVMGAPTYQGNKHTFSRVGTRYTIFACWFVRKDPSASVEIVDQISTGDWFTVSTGTLIVGPGATLKGGNRHQNIIGPKGTVVMTSGSVFKTNGEKYFAFDLDVFGKFLAGTVERPLTSDVTMLLNFKGKTKETHPGCSANDRSIRFNKTSSLIITSADPTKARLMFDGRKLADNDWTKKDCPSIDMQFGGTLKIDGMLFDKVALGGIQLPDPVAKKEWKHVSFGEKNLGSGDALFSASGAVLGTIEGGDRNVQELKDLEDIKAK